MVLGISIRKKKSTPVPKPVRTPSLPDIRAQSLVWPESLVDLPLLNRKDAPPPIASKYTSPSTNTNPSRTPSLSNRRASFGQRRTRAPAPFNLMVAGPRGVGKTALLRLLLQMSDPPAQLDMSFRPTRALTTSTVELAGQDRVLLKVIDTPGLDFSEGAELELEKAVTGLVKHIDSQYAETLGEESKVVRQSKGDHHVHLCLYLIDPSTIQSPAQRQRAHQALRATRSYTGLASPRADTPDDSSHDSDYDSDSDESIGLVPSEIRAIQRLANRTNILPVIARGDTLTDARLEKVRKAIRRDLSRAGVDMTVFGIGEEEIPERGRKDSRLTIGPGQEEPKVIKIRSTRLPSRTRSTQRTEESVASTSGLGLDTNTGNSPISTSSDVHLIPRTDDATLARMFPLVTIAPDIVKPKRGSKGGTASPKELSASPELPGTPTAITTDDPDLPSAELNGNGKMTSPTMGRSPSAYPPSALPPSSWRPGFGGSSIRQYTFPEPDAPGGSGGARTYPRGAFTRKYRWGTIDVLDPAHCDVSVLRGVILGSHLNTLKIHTREVLYEKFRTEKLLARRATQNITPEQRSRLMK
ncbi:hypothetical protein FRC07_002656, partial [Ceratobasidium sp. 392]